MAFPFFITLLLLLVPGQDGGKKTPEGVSVSASLEPVGGEIGDIFTYTIQVRYRPGHQVRLPERLGLGKFVVLEDHHFEEKSGSEKTERFVFKISVYETGSIELPAVPLLVKMPSGDEISVETSGFQVEIRSLLPPDAGIEDMKDIAPPVKAIIPSYLLLYALGAVAAVGLAAVVGIYVRKRFGTKKEAEAPLGPPEPAHHVALKRLRILTGENLLGKGMFKEYYYRISETIREYFGLRYGFHSLEMTTSELLAQLKDLSPEGFDKVVVGSWMERCDMVKFATYVPETRENEDTYRVALAVIEATRERGEAKAGRMSRAA